MCYMALKLRQHFYLPMEKPGLCFHVWSPYYPPEVRLNPLGTKGGDVYNTFLESFRRDGGRKFSRVYKQDKMEKRGYRIWGWWYRFIKRWLLIKSMSSQWIKIKSMDNASTTCVSFQYIFRVQGIYSNLQPTSIVEKFRRNCRTTVWPTGFR